MTPTQYATWVHFFVRGQLVNIDDETMEIHNGHGGWVLRDQIVHPVRRMFGMMHGGDSMGVDDVIGVVLRDRVAMVFKNFEAVFAWLATLSSAADYPALLSLAEIIRAAN